MKKILLTLLVVFLFVPFFVCAKSDKKDDKVKVYIFEAGGCPYCEMEVEYLKGLESYNKKFTIVKKELYVDHVDWKEGKDYKLGVKVATAFNEAGFEDAAYTGTPFVVISDLYAAATYSEDLEDIILEAYEEGDKDAVSCINKGKEDCIRPINTEDLPNTVPTEETKGAWVIALFGGIALIATIVYVFKTRRNNKEEVEEEVKPVKKEPVKKTPVKKTTKKTTKK